MDWHVIYTKPKQENLALENLQRQGYECYLPVLLVEKIFKGRLMSQREPLFPRYLFIRLGLGASAKSWAPIRSTRGVSRIVGFGGNYSLVDNELIELLRTRESSLGGKSLFEPGEPVDLIESPFTNVEGIYQMTEADNRVLVLIEILSKPVVVRVSPGSLRKASR